MHMCSVYIQFATLLHACSIIVNNYNWICKMDLPHISNLNTSTIHNFGHVKAMDMEFAKLRVLLVHIKW